MNIFQSLCDLFVSIISSVLSLDFILYSLTALIVLCLVIFILKKVF